MNTDKLKEMMKQKNISIYRLSKLTGLDDKGLGCIVNGKTKYPQVSTLLKIAKALELSNDEFAKLCGYDVNMKSYTPLDIKVGKNEKE